MIRPLNENDLDSFMRIRLNSLKNHPEAFGSAFEDGMDTEKTRRDLAAKGEQNFILGFFEDTKLVGMVGFIRRTNRKEVHKGIIWGVYIEPSYTGQGIGRRLMEACLEKATHLPGLEFVFLGVSRTAKAAHNLYQSLGFELWGVEPEALRLGEKSVDVLHMFKRIDREPSELKDV